MVPGVSKVLIAFIFKRYKSTNNVYYCIALYSNSYGTTIINGGIFCYRLSLCLVKKYVKMTCGAW